MTTTADRAPDAAAFAAARERLERLVANIERCVFGKRRQVLLAVTGLLAEGHVLLEDAPGTGKTTLARSLAKSLDLEFRRVQFTSDLLPSDVLGVSVHETAGTPGATRGEFVFKPGPVFTNVLLADELNRTNPRTQSALLEAMNDRRVSVDGRTHDLPRPFLVIATQNPLEFEGTYPLPESQLDRFLVRIAMGHPSREDERRVLRSRGGGTDADSLAPVLARADLVALIELAKDVRIDAAIEDYVLSLLEATRRGGRFLAGLSTRAGVGLVRAARAKALIEGRSYVIPDDVKDLAVPVLSHRLVASPTSSDSGDASRVLTDILSRLAVPA